MNQGTIVRIGIVGLSVALIALLSTAVRSDTVFFAGTPPTIAQAPLYIEDAVPPLNMLVMGKDHKIYYEAYNDASDLDGDGILDVGYRGWEEKASAPTDGSSRYKIDYYGYFNSYVCYEWEDANGGRFVPDSPTNNKQCSGAWSGDFLNYLTMSRMDSLRRVLYGGWRQVDTATDTVLQGAYFPQDAHSWGKEYRSVERDGYDISRYAPLGPPADGTYHLFAVTTVTGNGNTFPNYQAPLFRVMQNSPYRVWNWLSIEGPVAGNNCFTSSNTRTACISSSNLPHPGHPADRAAYNNLVTTYATADNLFGTSTVDRIDCTNGACNLQGRDDNYLTLVSGLITIASGRGGNYEFAIDGDDAVDFELRVGSATGALVNNSRIGCYGGRGLSGGNGCASTGNLNLTAGTTYYIAFRHEEAGGGDGYQLRWRKPSGTGNFGYRILDIDDDNNNNLSNTSRRSFSFAFYDLTPPNPSAASRRDYLVRVQTCPRGMADAALRDSTCKAYGVAPNVSYKPTGILHDYGEGDAPKMYFGLITGSQSNNLEGGVLRSNIENFNREIDPATGVFTRTAGGGIVDSIDRLRMIGGGYNSSVTDNLNGDTNWNWANGTGNCVSQGGRVLDNGECRMWGNPIAEMLFEGLRYFAGAGTGATSRFSTGGSTEGATEDNSLGLPTPAWRNPYADTVDANGAVTRQGYPSCARPHQTIISDINPSYDSDLPGSAFATIGEDAALPGFDAAGQGGSIWTAEFGGARNVFVGEVQGTPGDGAPTAKSVSSFGNIRGLAPEEPTKQGTYYSASVARYGRHRDISTAADGNQYVSTYSIALASPLPRIEFPVNGQMVTLLPFAKTVSGTFGGNPIKPTNTIVDFYVESFANFPAQAPDTTINDGRPRAVFRINYEDVEQGNDHDMDMIVRYTVEDIGGGGIRVTLDSEYAAGSANQNAGYVISGTTSDGIYLEVRDRDSAQNTSVYELNTPAGVWAGGCVGATGSAPCNQGLGLSASRTFTAGSAGVGIQLRDPLWYAAKYGSPDAPGAPAFPGRTPRAWDAGNAGEPYNYFLVSNPLNLRAQMREAFDNISEQGIDAGSQALTGARVGSGSFTLQPSFGRERNGKDWFGNLSATAVYQDGTLAPTPLWDAAARLPVHGSRKIHAVTLPGVSSVRTAVEFRGDNNNLGANDGDRLNALGITQNLSTTPNAYGAVYSAEAIVNYLRGDQSREVGQSGAGNTLRARSSVLGSIINSEPVIASPRADFGYGSFADAMFSGYSGTGGYVAAKASRDTVAYVGANDGMLHAFDANTVPCAGPNGTTVACAAGGAGGELFAFIPQASLRRMGELALPDALYEHRYYVDGQITVTDAKDGSTWKTVLAATMGGGGRSVFALDVSNPGSFGNGSVLWELNGKTDNDIGNIYGRPLLLPLENDRWGVLFGNGYGGNTSDPSLYVVDAFTGQQIAKLTADDEEPATAVSAVTGWICSVIGLLCAENGHPFNGLGQITAIDRDGNGKADAVYGGDLQGNLWKFDLSNTSASAWEVAFGGEPLITARTASGQRQPITGGIRVSAGPGAGVMVYFGTGRYFVEGDNNLPVPANRDVQSLYGIFDNGTPVVIPDPDDRDDILQRQWIRGQTTGPIDTDGNGTPDTDVTTRDISRNRVGYYGPAAKRGWYLDLVIDNVDGDASGVDYSPEGERFIATPRIQSGRVFFTSFSPTGDSCEPGGTNFVYALDLLSGSGALSNVASLGSASPSCTGENCGAVQIPDAGAPITSTSVAAINPTRFVTSTGPASACPVGEVCPSFQECQVVIYPGGFVLPRPCGRQSWRQLK